MLFAGQHHPVCRVSLKQERMNYFFSSFLLLQNSCGRAKVIFIFNALICSIFSENLRLCNISIHNRSIPDPRHQRLTDCVIMAVH